MSLPIILFLNHHDYSAFTSVTPLPLDEFATAMDGDPAVEPELDSFSLTVPLPYRVALTVVLGMGCASLLCSGSNIL